MDKKFAGIERVLAPIIVIGIPGLGKPGFAPTDVIEPTFNDPTDI